MGLGISAVGGVSIGGGGSAPAGTSAAGGTSAAVAGLVESLGGRVAGLGFLIELDFLKGRDRISSYEIHSVLKY